MSDVVEARLQELGGEPKVESAVDRAARYQRARALEDARRAFQSSPQGIKQADDAFAATMSALGAKIGAIAASTLGELQHLSLNLHSGKWLLMGPGASMTIQWRKRFAYNLEGAAVIAVTFDGVPSLPGIIPFEPGRSLRQWQFEYAMLSMDRFGYIDASNRHRSFTEDQLAEHLLKLYFDAAESLGHH